MSDGVPRQDLPAGFSFRPYRGNEDHGTMAAVRLGCAEQDRVDVHSIVEGYGL
jgi:mycothiol synthase